MVPRVEIRVFSTWCARNPPGIDPPPSPLLRDESSSTFLSSAPALLFLLFSRAPVPPSLQPSLSFAARTHLPARRWRFGLTNSGGAEGKIVSWSGISASIPTHRPECEERARALSLSSLASHVCVCAVASCARQVRGIIYFRILRFAPSSDSASLPLRRPPAGRLRKQVFGNNPCGSQL